MCSIEGVLREIGNAFGRSEMEHSRTIARGIARRRVGISNCWWRKWRVTTTTTTTTTTTARLIEFRAKCYSLIVTQRWQLSLIHSSSASFLETFVDSTPSLWNYNHLCLLSFAKTTAAHYWLLARFGCQRNSHTVNSRWRLLQRLFSLNQRTMLKIRQNIVQLNTWSFDTFFSANIMPFQPTTDKKPKIKEKKTWTFQLNFTIGLCWSACRSMRLSMAITRSRQCIECWQIN